MSSRRLFLQKCIGIFPATSLFLSACNESQSTLLALNNRTPSADTLLPADENGLRLLPGFTSRIIARSQSPVVEGSDYIWHSAPDGGATFPTKNHGWIYVSNSELGNNNGGVGAIEFNRHGNIINAYSILNNTSQNCAGGATPWNTWLSCEETNRGRIWQCDPYGKQPATALPALGLFAHEAIAVDTVNNHFYMTEDKKDGCLYRFIPKSVSANGIADLTSGKLEVAILNTANSTLSWQIIPDPSARNLTTRKQIKAGEKFNGGEGIVYHKNIISFATKGDNKIWALDTRSQILRTIYDVQTSTNPILSGVDNLAVTPKGELIISEDGGDLQIVTIKKDLSLAPLVQAVGHNKSELTGPAFSPDGKRLYFSSQRGNEGSSSNGVTFEVSGPFA